MELPKLSSLFDLSGQVALVTGGSRGLGLEMAEGLGEAGAKIVITARREPELREAEQHLLEMGMEVLAVPGSVSDPAAVEALIGAAIGRFGRLDILVNNAGVSWGAPTAEMPLDRWQYVIDTNLTGTWLLSQAACRVMIQQGQGGRIINISSLAGLRGSLPSVLPAIGYSASKAGIIGLTQTLAVHMAPHNILVNAICPGFFLTKLSRPILEKSAESVRTGSPLGRIGQPGELKGVVVFLAGRASSYMTGQVLPVDGGATAW
ncbi:MAG TPA: SDR family oxidoreductase [Symbiobacteriaceae bacterium]